MSTWTCDKCGRQFTRKTWHSCGTYTLENHFRKADPPIRKAFEILVDTLRKFGTLKVDPVKTSISLSCRIFFASVVVGKGSLQIDFVSPRKISSPRLSKSVFGQRNYYNTLRIKTPEEVDSELLNWLKEAMVLAG